MTGHIESLVPLIHNEQGDLQEAMNTAVAIVFQAVQDFDESAEKLLDMHHESSVQYEALSKFVNGCQFACTANLDWR